MSKAIIDEGAELAPSTPGQFEHFLAAEIDRLGKIARSAGIHAGP